MQPEPEPVKELKIWEMMNDAESRMTSRQQRFFEMVRIAPEKWSQTPYGDHTGGFWVVGLLGRTVIWYNEVEHGFNSSRYSSYGTIDEYWCNQDELERALQIILDNMNPDLTFGPDQGKAGPPKPGRYR